MLISHFFGFFYWTRPRRTLPRQPITSIRLFLFYLRFGEGERGGELGALGDGQVLFLAELLFQRHQLLRGEGRARLAVGLVLAQLAAQLAWSQFRQAVQTAVVQTRRQLQVGVFCSSTHTHTHRQRLYP